MYNGGIIQKEDKRLDEQEDFQYSSDKQNASSFILVELQSWKLTERT